MTQSEKRLITFISWSGIVVGCISMLGYTIVGYWLDSLYGAVAMAFFAFILYLIKNKRISYNSASLLFSAFGVVIVTVGFITSVSVEDGLIYMVIPTIIIALLRPPFEAVAWLLPYYAVFFLLNILNIPNHSISINVFMQLFAIHMVLFLIISYFRKQERALSMQLLLLNEQLQEEVTIDALTGAYNRRAFHTILDRAVATYSIDHQEFVLALIDIDHFKRVNDRYGHQKGDEVLRKLVNHFKSKIRHSDTVIRYGGEEFIVCFTHIDMKKAVSIMEGMCRSVESLKLLENEKLTISAGISKLEASDTSASILSRADAALYEAKESGRNRVVQK